MENQIKKLWTLKWILTCVWKLLWAILKIIDVIFSFSKWLKRFIFKCFQNSATHNHTFWKSNADMRFTFAKTICSSNSTNRLPGHILLPQPKGTTKNGDFRVSSSSHLFGLYEVASTKLLLSRHANHVCSNTTLFWKT